MFFIERKEYIRILNFIKQSLLTNLNENKTFAEVRHYPILLPQS